MRHFIALNPSYYLYLSCFEIENGCFSEIDPEFAKFLSFSKLQVSFFSNFASFFSVM